MMLGQFVQALEDARTSVQLEPNFVKGYIRVAKCCVALGEIHAARQVYKYYLNSTKTINVDFQHTHTQNVLRYKEFMKKDCQSTFLVKIPMKKIVDNK